ncbi:hypothetical protein BZA70DRAFT_309711 [Myxozyma melibiosi]|uniref:MPN domain-containing protein n=1 Tax=Myxozyma melibiosi TaxID=54550 RepID=A0ABR1FAP3_9ASCO
MASSTETDQTPSIVLRNQSGHSTDLTIGLHPLAILNISDYYTRAHLSGKELLGGLIGKQTGRDVSIEQSFEFSVTDGNINEELVVTKLEQFKTCFETLDFVGWFYIPLQPPYEPSEAILSVHQYLAKFHNDTPPLLLILDPRIDSMTTSQKLPITIYETLFTEEGKPVFAEVQHRIESFEAEHVGVLYVAKQDQVVQPSHDAIVSGGSQLAESSTSAQKDVSEDLLHNNDAEEIVSQINSQANAVKMLAARVDIIRRYLEYIMTIPESAFTAADFEILREINALVGQLSTENITAIAQGQQFDGLLAALLGLVTKGVKHGVDLNAKRNTLDVQLRGRMDKIPSLLRP